MIRDNPSICNFIKNVWEQYDTTHLPFRCMRAVWQSIVLDPCTLQSSQTFVLVAHVTVCTTSCCERFTSSYGFFFKEIEFFWCSVWATCILTKSKVRSCESKSRNFVPSRFPLATWYVFSHVRFDWMQKSWTEIIQVLLNRDNVYRYLWTGPALSYPFSLKVLFYAK